MYVLTWEQPNNMEEKIKTKVFNAIRVKEADHTELTEYLKPFDPKHEGISALLAAIKNEPQIKEVHQNMEQLFEHESYAAFIQDGDTDILDAIKRGLVKANTEAPEQTPQAPAAIANVTDFVPADLIGKVNLLHRDLKMKKQIPENSTPEEYQKQLLIYSLRYFLINEYRDLYDRK